MRYGWTTIQVNNLDTSVAFYRDILHLPLTRRFQAGPGTEIAFLGEGETQIELIQHTTEAPLVGKGISLGFVVDSLDDTLATFAKQGIEIESGSFQHNPRIKFFYLLDPSGVRIQISQTM